MSGINQLSEFQKVPRPAMRWFESLHFRFAFFQLLLLVFIIGTTVMIMITVERKLLLDQGYDLAEQLGHRVISQLEGRIVLAEAVVVSLANLSASLEHNIDVYKKIIPELLDYKGEESFIAGGGIWPQPNHFTPGIERRSFFWGRDAQGKLQYYDDYNNPAGRGYHHEEWYVPALLYPPARGFWSKSYMDPYSYQPMVTCSVPIYENKAVSGVATVDLKLEGLQFFFSEASHLLGGYIFAVDRNNKLLSFPKPDLVKHYGKDEKAKVTQEFFNARDLAKKFPAYQVVADNLDAINQDMIAAAQARPEFDKVRIQGIDKESDQINYDEALLTSAILSDLTAKSSYSKSFSIRRILIENDAILKKQAMAFIFQMPRTYWKIIVVIPTAKFLIAADVATLKVASYIVILELLALVIMFFVLRLFFIGPIRKMALQVGRTLGAQETLNERLDDTPRHELGKLAYEFNYRTSWLASALERLDKVNEELEERVKLRTAELKGALEELKNTHAQLLQAEKLISIGRLAAGVAHEINNPVGFISNNMEVLQEYVSNYVRILNVLEQIIQSIEQDDLTRASAIIAEFEKLKTEIHLDFMSKDVGKLLEQSMVGIERIRKIVMDLRTFAREDHVETIELIKVEQVIDSILSIVQSEIKYKAELIKDYGDTPLIRGNAQRLGQVFINLLVNAAHSIVDRGQILIRTYVKDQCVCIDIQDNGRGISQENVAKIFDPFFTTKPVGQGTGLGLSVSYEIIKKHNGDLKVHSVLGQGSTFTVIVPAGLQES
jgi:two-component system NtrC family sensor kinase